MLRAVDKTCPQINLKELDLITDRKNLRALLDSVENEQDIVLMQR